MKLRDSFKKLKSNKIFFAITMNIIILLMMILFFYARYNCELDITMQSLLYGVSSKGKSISHLMFSNIFIGKALSVLFNIMPTVPWYTVFHYMMAFISMIVISYVVVSLSNNLTGKTIATVISIFIGYESYVIPMYMKTAVLMAVSSELLLGYIMFRRADMSTHDKLKKRVICIVQMIMAVILGVVGSWISYKAFMMSFLIGLTGVILLGILNKKILGGTLMTGNAVVLILMIAALSNGVDKHYYQEGSVWENAGNYRDAVEQLYAFGFPDYEDIEVLLKINGYMDVDKTTYSSVKNGVYSEELDNFSLLQLIAGERVELTPWKVLLFFHLVPIRAFKTGMFYLWLILAVVLLSKSHSAKTFGKLLISLLMIGIPYFIMYFRFGYQSLYLGMIAYLPAIIYLILDIGKVSMEEEQYMWVYLGLLGLVLYYNFSVTMVSKLEDTDEMSTILTVSEEHSGTAHLVDFNSYMQNFSIFTVYPKKVESKNLYIVNGVYRIVPGFRPLEKVKQKKWKKIKIYCRNNETEKVMVHNMDAYIHLKKYEHAYEDSFYGLKQLVYTKK